MPTSDFEPLSGIWRVGDVASYLATTEAAIYALVNRGEIPHLKLGRSVRFRQADIDAWFSSLARNGDTTPGEPLWTVKMLAKYLRTSEPAVYPTIRRQKLPHLRLGRTIRFRKSDIDRWMQSKRQGGIS